MRRLHKPPGPASLLIALIATAAYWVWGCLTIQPLPIEGELDSVQYLKMAKGFVNHQFGPIPHPFNLRPLASWIASFFSEDLLKTFLVLDGVYFVLTILGFFLFIRRLQAKAIYFYVFAAWLCLHPVGLSLYHLYPVHADPLSYAFLAWISYFFVARQRALLAVALGISLLVKESFVFVSLVVILSELAEILGAKTSQVHRRKGLLLTLLVGILLIFGYGALKEFMAQHWFYQEQLDKMSSLSILRVFGGMALERPIRIIIWLVAFICAWGYFFLLLFFNKQLFKVAKKDLRVDSYCVLGSVGFFLFGLLAGTDMTRILLSGSFFFIIFFIRQADEAKVSPELFLTISVASFILMFFYPAILSVHSEYYYYATAGVKRKVVPLLFLIANTIVLRFGFLLFKKQFDRD